MDLQIHLYKPQAIETELQDKLLSIVERAFPSTNAQRPQVLSHFVGSRSYCIVASISSQPVAFLFFQSRTALSSGTELSLLSVGPVATDPNFQRRGIGSQLIGYLNSYAVESNVDLIILSKLEKSKSEIRRLIKGSGVKINNQVINDEKLIISEKLFENDTIKLSLGKKRHIKVEIS